MLKKIEFNSNAEPIIVDVPESEFLAKSEEVEIQQVDFVEMKSSKSIGKQMAMNRIFGIQKNNDNVSKRQKVFKNVFTAAFIIFVVAVLIFTAYKDFFASERPATSWEDIKTILVSNWKYLLTAILCLFLFYLFKGLKNSVMCKTMTKKFHFITSMETAIVGNYYNNVTPLAVGGQPFEIYHLSKHGVHGGAAAAIPIATYFLNQIAFVLLCLASLILVSTNAFSAPKALIESFGAEFRVLASIGITTCFIVPCLVMLFSMLPKVCARLVHLVMTLGNKLKIVKNPKETTAKTIKNVIHNTKCLKLLASKPLVFIMVFLLSILENLANASIAFFTLKFFGFSLGVQTNFFMEWLQIVQITLLLFVSVSFVPTPGNLGATDLSFFLLFSFGLTAGLAFPAMVIWRMISFYSTILIGFLFAVFKKKADLKKQVSEFSPIDELASAEVEETTEQVETEEAENI